MNTLRLDLSNVYLPIYRLFDELVDVDSDADKKIDEGKQKIDDGDAKQGQADILEGAAQKIREGEDNNK